MSTSAMESKFHFFAFSSNKSKSKSFVFQYFPLSGPYESHQYESPSLPEHMFNLKFAVKDLERQAKKCEKEEKLELAKTKKAIQKGNTEVARIHAENAIRQKNQSLNYLRMSARVDAVASRVQSALVTRKVTNSMAGVVKAMDAAMKGMNLEKISGLMDKFESQFEDLDVQSSYMDNTMSQTVTTAVPQNDVDSLLQRVADEAG
jgi:charged multivesicular body protein 1